jgi:hypothetical protein
MYPFRLIAARTALPLRAGAHDDAPGLLTLQVHAVVASRVCADPAVLVGAVSLGRKVLVRGTLQRFVGTHFNFAWDE